jgi:demethylmenaquinone methyltransferase/2-methoxy-6-polyprenyl-1,4-benzoquinol methylase
MLAMGLDKVRRRGLADRVQLVRADATRVPLSSGSTDAVTIAFGIRNVEDPEAACREMLRVLVPGGRLAILEFAVPSSPLVRSVYMTYFKHVLPRLGRLISRHDTVHDYLLASVGAFAMPAEFASLLRGAGFVDVSIRPPHSRGRSAYSARKPGWRVSELESCRARELESCRVGKLESAHRAELRLNSPTLQFTN